MNGGSDRVERTTGATSATSRPDLSTDSQDLLAASIARQVQLALPAHDSTQEVAGSVEAALLNEGRTNELTLGYLRVAGLGALTLLAIAGYLNPSLVGATRLSVAIPIAGVVATLLAGVFLLVLRRGRYATWVLRWVPAADALTIALLIALVYAEPGLQVPAARPGLAAIGAAGCLFLTFSGAIRLSRTAQRLATLFSVADWALLAVVLAIPPLPATAVAVVLIVLGLFGNRLTLTMRRIIAFEVARDRLDQMYRAAQASVNAREEVLRMVAHDLRNPLSNIKMTAELIAEMPLDEEKRRKHASTIVRASQSMNRLIQDLLDFARMEAGRVQIQTAPTEVSRLLERVYEMMDPLATAEELTLEVQRPTGLPPVDVDAEEIERVFSNLIGNALKFTPPGGRIVLRGQRVGDKVRFAVVDTGPGIAPEGVATIFESFWQADQNDRRGIGLGLAIARHIVDDHGGTIGVESEVGVGSEFWFTVPVATSDPSGPQAAAPPGPDAPGPEPRS